MAYAQAAGRLRRWLAGRTLRGRLIAGLLALLVVAFTAVGAATYVAFDRILGNSLDQQLGIANKGYVSCLSEPAPDADQGEHGRPGPGGPRSLGTPATCAHQQADYTFTGELRHGQLIASAMDDAPRGWQLSAAGRAAIRDLPPGVPGTAQLPALGPYRLLAAPADHHPGMRFVTGLPLSPIQSTLRNVMVVEVILFGIVLLLTGVLGTGWVRLSLRPLRRVAATATRVTQLPLASGEVTLPERVPDADPRTEVGQVGTAFNRMLGHVESALSRRAASEARLRRFASDASHELRTPLAAVRGYAELIRHHPEDIAHPLSRLESEAARMSLLVDELLLLARLDAGRPLAGEPVDLTLLAVTVTSDARVVSPGHRWQLELPDEPVMVTGDEHRLHQVLANLTSNAARHTPPGTTITVALAAGPAPGPVELSVTDNGPGIPEELQLSVFERFARGDPSRSRAHGSTGLGLAIVEAVTAAHGGTVRLTSRPGHTRFAITLPGPDPAANPPPEPAAGAGPALDSSRPSLG